MYLATILPGYLSTTELVCTRVPGNEWLWTSTMFEIQ